MRILLLFSAILFVASCGKKDNIFISDEPAKIAIRAKDGNPAVPGAPAVNVRQPANRPLSDKFFLDGLL